MEEFMDNQYTISIIEVISDGKLNIHDLVNISLRQMFTVENIILENAMFI